MMMGSSVIQPSREEILTEARKLAQPSEIKKLLDEAAANFKALDERRVEIAKMQGEIAKMQGDLAKEREAVDAHAQDLAGREQKLAARAARIAAVLTKFEQALGEHATTLEQTP